MVRGSSELLYTFIKFQSGIAQDNYWPDSLMASELNYGDSGFGLYESSQ